MHQVSKIVFCHKTLHVSGIFCAHHQLYTWQLVCFMQVIWLLPRRVMLFQPDSPRQQPHNLHETYQLPRVHVMLLQPDSPRQRPHTLHETYQLPCVQLMTPDDGHRRCPKHVQFRDKIKFWVLDASCWLFIQRYVL
jgi:hypothetical protein